MNLFTTTALIAARPWWGGTVPFVGLMVGFLVGLTGMGGGAIMTPLMVLVGGIRPLVAVGTDFFWGTITRGIGAFLHYRQGNAEPALIRRLVSGSIPGAFAGGGILVHMHRTRGDMVSDGLVLRILGVTLICVAVTLLIQLLRGKRAIFDLEIAKDSRRQVLLTVLLGVVTGFLVSLTSVGSGSFTVICLLALYPRLTASRVVGSDLVHSLILVGTASLGHLGIGSIDGGLLLKLLIGSIPGVWLGSKVSVVLPERVLRPVLATTFLALGYKLL